MTHRYRCCPRSPEEKTPPETTPFETYADRYDRWFEQHPEAHHSETAPRSRPVPEDGFGLEIGVESGRFAGPLGADSVRGVAEALPFAPDQFDFLLNVTTMCFLDAVPATLHETRRVLRLGAEFVVDYVEADRPLGRRYLEKKE